MVVYFLNLIMRYFLGVGLININLLLWGLKDCDMAGAAHFMMKSGQNVGVGVYDPAQKQSI
jgi:hypothetical protein